MNNKERNALRPEFRELLTELGYIPLDEYKMIYHKNDKYQIILYQTYYAIKIMKGDDIDYFFSFGTFPLDTEMFHSDMRRIQREIK